MGTFVIFSSAWLARRLEVAEAMGTVRCGKDVLEIAGGYAVFGGSVSPMTQAIGVGMGTPVTAEDIDKIEEFYREREANSNIHLCPLADPSLAEILGARRYRPAEFTNMMMRMAPAAGTEYPPTPGVEVRAVEPHEAHAWANLVLRGFLDRDELTEPERELEKMASADRESIKLLATIDGAPAGGAAFSISGGVALFAGDSTLKPHRGCGIHMALLRAASDGGRSRSRSSGGDYAAGLDLATQLRAVRIPGDVHEGRDGEGVCAMKSMLLLLAASLCAVAADPAWKPFEFLVGDWVGEGTGQPGEGTGGFSFRFSLDGKVLIRENWADYPKTKEREAFSHKDQMVIYREAATAPFKAIYFDNEGHVIHYAISAGKDIQFVSEAAASSPRYRLTMRLTEPRVVAIEFEIAPPGAPDAFKSYIKAKARQR
jgi:hypothetical protein